MKASTEDVFCSKNESRCFDLADWSGLMIFCKQKKDPEDPKRILDCNERLQRFLTI